MKIVLKQNVINIVLGAICIAVEPVFIALVWVANASLEDRMLITLLFGVAIVFSALELLKSIFWRIVTNEDGFTFRNRWGRENTYSYSDIVSISVKGLCYVVLLADSRITIEYRSVNNCVYFFFEAARHGVKINQ